MPIALLGEINTAIFDTLKFADGLKLYQNYDQITEGIAGTPLLRVYWLDKTTDVSGSADRSTFRGGLRQTDMTFVADLYADTRGHINQIFPSIMPLVDNLDTIIEEQNIKPYFGHDAIKAFQWSVELTTFVHEQQAGTELKYPGVKFTFNVRVF